MLLVWVWVWVGFFYWTLKFMLFRFFSFGHEPPECVVCEEDYEMLWVLQQIRYCNVVTCRSPGVSRLNFHRGCTLKSVLQ